MFSLSLNQICLIIDLVLYSSLLMKKNKIIISALLCFSLAVSVALYLCIFPSPKTYDVSLQEIVASQSQENVQLIDLRTQSEVQKTGLIP